jgi:hypothetical protein
MTQFLQHEPPFTVQQLVLLHLPDICRGNTLIPIPGVVVTPGIEVSIVRIRNRTGQIEDIQVSTDDLNAR